MNKKEKKKSIIENIFKHKPKTRLCSLLWKYWLNFLSEIICYDNIYLSLMAGKLFKLHID